ncbi:pimeloyl-ACP methyl ester carboxylesterase [Paenibacillus castaneae]|nr:pimeloyl-ACP methyl ester carboxylesterase [Paenibacillus castaneae]
MAIRMSKLFEEKLVDLNGFSLYSETYGENKGNPTVIMDSGYGDDSKVWNLIVPEIAKSTKVLVYDRAGLGRSEKSPNPRTTKEMVNELDQLLTASKLKPPYVLVGHSFGGINVRMYASQFPENVSGIVLVDSTPEDYRDRFLPYMSKEFQEAYNNQFVSESTYDEFMDSLYQLKQNKRHLGSIPLIVISAGKKAHYSKEAQKLWHKLQTEMLEISENSEMIIAHNSTHYIQNDEPHIVINAIKKMLKSDCY